MSVPYYTGILLRQKKKKKNLSWPGFAFGFCSLHCSVRLMRDQDLSLVECLCFYIAVVSQSPTKTSLSIFSEVKAVGCW